MSDDEGESSSMNALFTEAPRPPSPDPTTFTYMRSVVPDQMPRAEGARSSSDISYLNWNRLEIKLVGSHPLWGHYLWNAAKAFAAFLDANPSLYANRNVLELGAGGGLPGIVTALNGARKVVLTDYPDNSLLNNLAENVHHNVTARKPQVVSVQGYIWGRSVNGLLEALGHTSDSEHKFDLVIMSDLIFNHSQHEALLRTCELTLSTEPSDGIVEPSILVFFSHHRPHLAERDMEFFTRAKASGWNCVKVLTERYPPMFPDDPGDEQVRATVHGWKLTRGGV